MPTLNAFGAEERNVMTNDRKELEDEVDELAAAATKTRIFHYTSELPDSEGSLRFEGNLRCVSRRLEQPPAGTCAVHIISLLVDVDELNQFEVGIGGAPMHMEWLIPAEWLTPERVAVIETFVKKPTE